MLVRRCLPLFHAADEFGDPLRSEGTGARASRPAPGVRLRARSASSLLPPRIAAASVARVSTARPPRLVRSDARLVHLPPVAHAVHGWPPAGAGRLPPP